MKLFLSIDGEVRYLDAALFEVSYNKYTNADASIIIGTTEMPEDAADTEVAVSRPSSESVVSDQIPNTIALDAVMTPEQKATHTELWGNQLRVVLPEDETFLGPTALEYTTDEFNATDPTSIKSALDQLFAWEREMRSKYPEHVFKVVVAPEIRFHDDHKFFKMYQMLGVYSRLVNKAS